VAARIAVLGHGEDRNSDQAEICRLKLRRAPQKRRTSASAASEWAALAKSSEFYYFKGTRAQVFKLSRWLFPKENA
jgi:hypothetical protein